MSSRYSTRRQEYGIVKLNTGPSDSDEEDSNERSKRSVVDKYKLGVRLDIVVKKRLTEFVMGSLRDQIDALNHNRSLEWSNDLNRLYNRYISSNWTNLVCPNSTIGFDHFLFSKSSQQPKWLECIIHDSVESSNDDDDWCPAARRVIFNADSDGKNIWLNKSSRPPQFLKDRKILWRLFNKIPALDKGPKISNTELDVNKEDTIFYNTLTSILNKMSSFNHLSKNVINLGFHALLKYRYIPCSEQKSVTANSHLNLLKDVYKRAWYTDTRGIIQCILNFF